MCRCNESSSSSSGSKNDPIEIDDSGEESEDGEEKVRGPTPYPGVLVPAEDRAEDAPRVEVAGTSGMVRVPEPVSINTLLEIMVNLLLESGRQVCRKSYVVRRGGRFEPYRVSLLEQCRKGTVIQGKDEYTGGWECTVSIHFPSSSLWKKK